MSSTFRAAGFEFGTAAERMRKISPDTLYEGGLHRLHPVQMSSRHQWPFLMNPLTANATDSQTVQASDSAPRCHIDTRSSHIASCRQSTTMLALISLACQPPESTTGRASHEIRSKFHSESTPWPSSTRLRHDPHDPGIQSIIRLRHEVRSLAPETAHCLNHGREKSGIAPCRLQRRADRPIATRASDRRDNGGGMRNIGRPNATTGFAQHDS